MNMKKILIAMMMIVGATNAHAFEFKVNGDTLLTEIVKQVVHQTVGTQIGDGKHVIVRTGNAAAQKKMTTCWTSTIYTSDGKAMPQLVCY
jgi:hypothetical protein